MEPRILFIRLSALGDIINTLPALSAYRLERPEASVDWVVEDRFADLLRLVEGVDRVIVFPRRKIGPTSAGISAFGRHLRGLRERRYDAAIDFQGNLKGALHLRCSVAAQRIGLVRSASREGAHWFADTRVRPPAGCHRVARALALIEPVCPGAGGSLRDGVLDAALLPVIRDDPEAAREVQERLAKLDPGAGPLVILHPGTSSFGTFKRWPAANFAVLARAIAKEHAARVLVPHGQGEQDLAREVASGSGGRAVSWSPSRGLAGLVALLRRADLVVAADSGPLLLASALGVRTVALFGPKNPAVYAPVFGDCRVVRGLAPCSPCSLRRCEDPVCMSGISPEQVLAAVREQLRRDPIRA